MKFGVLLSLFPLIRSYLCLQCCFVQNVFMQLLENQLMLMCFALTWSFSVFHDVIFYLQTTDFFFLETLIRSHQSFFFFSKTIIFLLSVEIFWRCVVVFLSFFFFFFFFKAFTGFAQCWRVQSFGLLSAWVCSLCSHHLRLQQTLSAEQCFLDLHQVKQKYFRWHIPPLKIFCNL